MKGKLSNVVAGAFAMAAFAVAVIAGMPGSSTASSVLFRALVAMVLCYPIGLIVGMICERVVENHIREHQMRNPAPPPPSDRIDPGGADAGAGHARNAR